MNLYIKLAKKELLITLIGTTAHQKDISKVDQILNQVLTHNDMIELNEVLMTILNACEYGMLDALKLIALNGANFRQRFPRLIEFDL